MQQRGAISLPIIVVLSAIGFMYYTTVFVFIDDWFGLKTSQGLMNAVAFTSMALMCLVTYGIAIVKDPGQVPETFVPDIEDSETPIHEIKRKCPRSGIYESSNSSQVSRVHEGGDLRFCQKCSHHKPPRAHHCRVCKRCVLRMDHHCIWINNCVGHANYKIFFVFVVYAVSASIHSLVLFVGSVLHDDPEVEKQSDSSSRLYYIISGLLLVSITMALSTLLGWHIYLTLRNKTTIEYHEGVRAMWLAKKVGNIYRHPYDIGPYENLTSVLGPNIFTWICPTSSHIGSGLRFQTAYDNTQ
ncbi:Palmitoyltransferase pfa4 [Thalictrum thalictroides]|uniref:S-acyltransferase n=1 Tax=Thalictrum thalictroides TaxID=46969 RepID=A0A7J6XBE8_THATH|nr:Palmitoyltransferase pfa4 [Thalictrum thalictroides]